MIAVLSAALAVAHPFGARYAAHVMELDVGRTEATVRYLADVPVPLVASAARPGEDPVEAMALELRAGLLLEADGQAVEMQARTPWTATPTSDTVQFSWDLAAPLPDGTRRVELSNANLPGVPAVFRGRVTVSDGLRVDDCTLWRLRDGELVLDETDRWRTDERHRTLGVTVHAPPPWSTRHGAPRLAADARGPAPVSRGFVAAMMALATVPLAAWGLWRRRRAVSA